MGLDPKVDAIKSNDDNFEGFNNFLEKIETKYYKDSNSSNLTPKINIVKLPKGHPRKSIFKVNKDCRKISREKNIV